MAQLFREFLAEATLRDQTKYGPVFSFTKQYGKWFVIDDNTYDGAPDSMMNQHGEGKTKGQAVVDLINQLEDDGIYSKEALERAAQEAFPEPDRM